MKTKLILLFCILVWLNTGCVTFKRHNVEQDQTIDDLSKTLSLPGELDPSTQPKTTVTPSPSENSPIETDTTPESSATIYNQTSTNQVGFMITKTPDLVTEMPLACSNPLGDDLSQKIIAFVAEWDGDAEIYLTKADGEEITQLTHNNVDDRYPQWSPDGKKIAAIAYENNEANGKLYTINADGSGYRILTPSGIFPSGGFSWAPDSQSIVFGGINEQTGFDEDQGLYIVDLDDGSLVNLTKDYYPIGIFNPIWSSDGYTIAFNVPIEPTFTHWQIITIKSDGTGLNEISSETYSDLLGEWHPQSDILLYKAFANYPDQIFTMDSTGSNQRQLTDTQFHNRFATWSPNGQWIAYSSVFDQNNIDESKNTSALHIMTFDGKTDMVLLQNTNNYEYLQWSPHGRYITFSQQIENKYNIYVLDICKLSVDLVVENIDSVEEPKWKP